MSTTDADLPALPHIPVVEKATVDVLGGKVIVELVAKDMVEALLHNYARAAIEADRARSQPAPSAAVPLKQGSVPGLLVMAVEHGLIPMHKIMDDDLQQALLAYTNAALVASPQPPTQQENS